MEQANVELVRSTIDGWNAGDVDAFMAPYADDVVLETPPDFPEGGTVSGADEVRRFFVSLREGWESGTSVVLRRLYAVGDDRVMAEFQWRGTGEASGVEAWFDTLGLFTVRAGRIARAQFFFDRDDGLRAAGLDRAPPQSTRGAG